MKVLQLIDSLEAGGAERMAVTIANSLSEKLEGSYLCATRAEGNLKETILPKVGYLFLKKEKTLDFKALFKLRTFIKTNKITIVHAHTTSYFFSTLLKITYPSVQLIWHEHQGNRVNSKKSDFRPLLLCSYFFNKIITVNTELKAWCSQNLKTEHVFYLSNFTSISEVSLEKIPRENTVICLANLKPPKNHLLLLKAFLIVVEKHATWKLQLLGKDFNNSYSATLKKYVLENNLEEKVSFLDSVINPQAYLNSAKIGVLASNNEGLPMALLEYGANTLAVVTTGVGQCKEVISGFGKVVPPKDSVALANAILYYIENETERKKDAENFKIHIQHNYSIEAVLPELLKIYKS